MRSWVGRPAGPEIACNGSHRCVCGCCVCASLVNATKGPGSPLGRSGVCVRVGVGVCFGVALFVLHVPGLRCVSPCSPPAPRAHTVLGLMSQRVQRLSGGSGLAGSQVLASVVQRLGDVAAAGVGGRARRACDRVGCDGMPRTSATMWPTALAKLASLPLAGSVATVHPAATTQANAAAKAAGQLHDAAMQLHELGSCMRC